MNQSKHSASVLVFPLSVSTTVLLRILCLWRMNAYLYGFPSARLPIKTTGFPLADIVLMNRRISVYRRLTRCTPYGLADGGIGAVWSGTSSWPLVGLYRLLCVTFWISSELKLRSILSKHWRSTPLWQHMIRNSNLQFHFPLGKWNCVGVRENLFTHF